MSNTPEPVNEKPAAEIRGGDRPSDYMPDIPPPWNQINPFENTTVSDDEGTEDIDDLDDDE